MTLRARLLLVVIGLLAIALVGTGLLVVGLTRASLIGQLDDDLRSASLADISDFGPPQRPGDPTGRRYALFLLSPDGNVVFSVPSGFPSAPDPLPTIPAATGDTMP